MNPTKPKILWTDGSASPNPGPGGYAVLENGEPVALGSEDPSTNIRMEGFAIKHAILFAGEAGCEIHTDSEFWINVLTKWAPSWQANGWKKKSGPIKNLELVQELYGLYTKFPVTLVWEKGHAGTEYNELADTWANKARAGATIAQSDPALDIFSNFLIAYYCYFMLQ